MNDREYLVRKNLLKSLAAADGLLVLDQHLYADVSMATPRLSPTEHDDAVLSAEEDRLITSVRGERVMKYKINDAGQAWLSENRH